MSEHNHSNAPHSNERDEFGTISASALASKFMDKLRATFEGGDPPWRPTGFPELDEHIGGLRPGHLNVIAGRSWSDIDAIVGSMRRAGGPVFLTVKKFVSGPDLEHSVIRAKHDAMNEEVPIVAAVAVPNANDCGHHEILSDDLDDVFHLHADLVLLVDRLNKDTVTVAVAKFRSGPRGVVQIHLPVRG